MLAYLLAALSVVTNQPKGPKGEVGPAGPNGGVVPMTGATKLAFFSLELAEGVGSVEFEHGLGAQAIGCVFSLQLIEAGATGFALQWSNASATKIKLERSNTTKKVKLTGMAWI